MCCEDFSEEEESSYAYRTAQEGNRARAMATVIGKHCHAEIAGW